MEDQNIGFANRALSSIEPCGDDWFRTQQDGICRLMLADGLGHGEHAHRIVTLLRKQMLWLSQRSIRLPSIIDCLHNLHEQLTNQGQDWQAALAIVDIHLSNDNMRAVSIGNVDVQCLSKLESFHFAALRGMVGGRIPNQPRLQNHLPKQPALLALFSDGISNLEAQLYLKALAGNSRLLKMNAQSIAEKVVRDYSKATDDASCVIKLIGAQST